MEDKVKEKVETYKGPVTLTLTNIPRSVHRRLLKYRRKINSERQKDYNLKASYVEFLKEATKSIKCVAIIVALLLSSCSAVTINGIRVKQKPYIDGRQKFYCVAAAVAGYAIGTHFKSQGPKK